jgi:hypothetical protein
MNETIEYTETTVGSKKVKHTLDSVVTMVVEKLAQQLSSTFIYDSEPYLDCYDNGDNVEVSIMKDDLIELDGDFQKELKDDIIKAMTQMTLKKESK